MFEHPTRRILDGDVEGAVNLRDLGGYRSTNGIVRDRRIYRSAFTHFLTTTGLDYVSNIMGVRTVIDFRNALELEADGVSPFADYQISHRRLPVSGNTSLTPDEQQQRLDAFRKGTVDWGAMYRRMLTEASCAYADFFHILAEQNAFPLIFHCTGGRDRTGLAAALLLGMLGVDDETIAHDYSLTGAALLPHIDRFVRVMAEMDLTKDEWQRLVATTGEPILELLADIRNAHGSIPQYLQSIGIDDAVQGRIRDQLIA
jgi:protein-tyrosine phosphatase